MEVNKIYCGDVLKILKTLPDECVDTIITSPPYWGLRDYGEDTKTIWDGDKNCEHKFDIVVDTLRKATLGDKPSPKSIIAIRRTNAENRPGKPSQFCSKCGAWYGQLGLEPTLDLYLSHLWQITDQLYRILKKTGIMFWNHGDSYGGSGNRKGHTLETSNLNRLTIGYGGTEGNQVATKGLEKCMLLQNWRLILGMIDIDYRILVEWRVLGKPEGKLEDMLKHSKIQGILRNSIIWNKPNHMPSSVKDRFANAYEPVFMLTKNSNPIYYCNVKTGLMADRKAKDPKENVDWEWRECPKCTNKEYFNVRVRDSHLNRFMEKATEKEIESIEKGKCPRCKGAGKIKYSFWRALNYWFDLDAVRIKVNYPEDVARRIRQDKEAGVKPFQKGTDTARHTKISQGQAESFGSPRTRYHRDKTQNESYKASSMRNAPKPTEPNAFNLTGKNPGDVWEAFQGNPPTNWYRMGEDPKGKNPSDLWKIPTQPFPKAHFATFPEDLVKPMILVGCPKWVCKKCGKARVRISKTEQIIIKEFKDKGKAKEVLEASDKRNVLPRTRTGLETRAEHQTIGWTDCGCNAGWRPGVVLDPFGGSGTVGKVAVKLGRDYIIIDIKKEYCGMAEARIKSTQIELL